MSQSLTKGHMRHWQTDFFSFGQRRLSFQKAKGSGCGESPAVACEDGWSFFVVGDFNGETKRRLQPEAAVLFRL